MTSIEERHSMLSYRETVTAGDTTYDVEARVLLYIDNICINLVKQEDRMRNVHAVSLSEVMGCRALELKTCDLPTFSRSQPKVASVEIRIREWEVYTRSTEAGATLCPFRSTSFAHRRSPRNQTLP